MKSYQLVHHWQGPKGVIGPAGNLGPPGTKGSKGAVGTQARNL